MEIVRSRITSLAVLALLATSVLTGVAGAQGDGGDRPPEHQDPSEEYFGIRARSGTLDTDAGKLTLRGVSDEVVVQTDDPDHPDSRTTLSDLVDDWDEEGLDDTPPNAVLVVNRGEGRGGVEALELSDPTRDDDEITFEVEPVDSLDDAPVADVLKEHVREATQDVPEDFGAATLTVDPENDIMQWCYGKILNHTGSTLAGSGKLLLFPMSTPIGFIAKDGETLAAASGTGLCDIHYSYTTGARSWTISMQAMTKRDNVSSCSGNCVRTVTHDTSTYRVTFEFR